MINCHIFTWIINLILYYDINVPGIFSIRFLAHLYLYIFSEYCESSISLILFPFLHLLSLSPPLSSLPILTVRLFFIYTSHQCSSPFITREKIISYLFVSLSEFILFLVGIPPPSLSLYLSISQLWSRWERKEEREKQDKSELKKGKEEKATKKKKRTNEEMRYVVDENERFQDKKETMPVIMKVSLNSPTLPCVIWHQRELADVRENTPTTLRGRRTRWVI